ncbi:MAG TPA: peroxiredoxin [Bacteroidales bacterium]|nr:peroxiredoxin [Bacteroidales bacterium]HPS62994.1 peroxiredoxin [Bacteroidales bacterium]
MKTYIAAILFMILCPPFIQAQVKPVAGFPMLGQEAPSFTAESTQGTIQFPGDYSGKWKILFCHPADFTPVCTSEIMELAAVQDEFEKFRTQIVVLSVDPLDKHREWVKSMESFSLKGKDKVKIGFPLVSDPNLAVSHLYGMIHPGLSTSRDVRGVFIIDPENKIRAMYYYPMNVGRNTGEIERTLAALQMADKQEVLIPANWQPGGDVLLPFVKSKEEASKLVSSDDPDYYQPVWYMMYRKGKK